MGKSAVFLDRDDTVIKNVPYLGDPKLVKLMPGVSEALAKLQQADFLFIVISNQSGVGRGLITKEQVRSVDAKMEELLGLKNIFAAYAHCFAAPGDPYDDRRKPSPAMLFETAADLPIDLKKSFMVGNRLSDIQAGNSAGCQTVLLSLCVPPDEMEEASRLASFVAADWPKAGEWILKKAAQTK